MSEHELAFMKRLLLVFRLALRTGLRPTIGA
jgi:hypothetical protein